MLVDVIGNCDLIVLKFNKKLPKLTFSIGFFCAVLIFTYLLNVALIIIMFLVF